MLPQLALYGYFRSSAAFRVRIALNLKGLKPDLRFVHLQKNGGEQHSGAYKDINPQQIVPTLIVEGQAIGQSLAILEYLEEIAPTPPLLPADPIARAHVRQMALAVACDIHPLNTLRVQQQLERQFGADSAAKLAWQQHWLAAGLSALETMAAKSSGAFCFGDQPTMADVCLIPQMFNARLVQLDLTPYPALLRIEAAAYRVEAFTQARPENQPDAG